MWKLSILDDQGQKTVVNLVRDEYSIGRAEGNTVRLTERNVSRHHAQIVRTPFGYAIIDTGSHLGVQVNGVRVGGTHELAHRDLIQLGDYRAEVIDEDLETQEQGHRPFSSAPPSGRLPDRLVVLIGPNQGMEYALEGDRFLIGRGEECDFCIEHASVSRVHAEVRRADPTHFEIIDKGSANGLRVNGHEMPRSLLDSRDVVELGDVVLKFIPQGQVFRANPAEGQRIAALGGLGPPPPETLDRSPSTRSLLAAAAGGLLAAGLAFAWYSSASSEPSAGEEPKPVAQSPQIQSAPPLPAAVQAPTENTEAATWARATIDEAERTHDTAARRALLDQVTRNDAVPSELREAAFAALKELNEGSIDLSDLDGAAKKKSSSRRP